MMAVQKNNRCAIEIYLTTVLSDIFGFIMDHGISLPSHRSNIVDGIHATDTLYLK